MPVAEMLSRISSAELVEWAAYAQVEPFGAEWDNWRSGLIASTIENVNRAENTRAVSPIDRMPGKKKKSEKDQMLASLAGMRALAAIGKTSA